MVIDPAECHSFSTKLSGTGTVDNSLRTALKVFLVFLQRQKFVATFKFTPVVYVLNHSHSKQGFSIEHSVSTSWTVGFLALGADKVTVRADMDWSCSWNFEADREFQLDT